MTIMMMPAIEISWFIDMIFGSLLLLILVAVVVIEPLLSPSSSPPSAQVQQSVNHATMRGYCVGLFDNDTPFNTLAFEPVVEAVGFHVGGTTCQINTGAL